MPSCLSRWRARLTQASSNLGQPKFLLRPISTWPGQACPWYLTDYMSLRSFLGGLFLGGEGGIWVSLACVVGGPCGGHPHKSWTATQHPHTFQTHQHNTHTNHGHTNTVWPKPCNMNPGQIQPRPRVGQILAFLGRIRLDREVEIGQSRIGHSPIGKSNWPKSTR